MDFNDEDKVGRLTEYVNSLQFAKSFGFISTKD